jgi:DNA-binding NarL/FixJ family response regulator
MSNWSRGILDKLYNRQAFKVFVLEDNRMFLESLKFSLNKSFDKKLELTTFSESSSLIKGLTISPDVLVMDYHLDDDSIIEGIELVKYVRSHHPKTQIIVLTSENRLQTALDCYKEGVCNYIKKDNGSINKLIKELSYKKDLSKAA